MLTSQVDGTIRVLLDNGIVGHAEFAEPAGEVRHLQWGRKDVVINVAGFRRKKAAEEEGYQREKDTLFTVGRLVREGAHCAYSYSELRFEAARGRSRVPQFNALAGGKINHCSPALERSRFVRTLNYPAYFSKGGKKDKQSGISDIGFSQVAFLTWLANLDDKAVASLIQLKTKSV